MDMTVASIQPDSPASATALCAGDQVLRFNGRDDLEDLFDVQFEVTASDTTDSAYVELAVRHTDGTEEIIQIRKNAEQSFDELGIVFTRPIFTPIKTCNNACPFCFIDQQPEGLRPSLYVKDDDYRLSYFNGTYITLTNLTEHDRRRIEMIRPGPLYISVHATTPEVRIQLLKNPKFAGRIMEELRWLKSLEIPFHCQVVVCPGINDGDILSKTLDDLATLRPAAESVAVVPVGLTQYRDALDALTAVDVACAKDTVERVEEFQKKRTEFVYLSDEFYAKAGRPLPTYEAYGDFPQLEDGVGTGRMLLQGFYELEDTLPKAIGHPRNVLLLTGKLAGMVLAPIAQRLSAIENLFVDLITVEARFWGAGASVAGLVVGQDIIEALAGTDLSGYDVAIIPSVMLKQDSELFLDGKTVKEVSEATGVPFAVVQDAYSAQELIQTVLA